MTIKNDYKIAIEVDGGLFAVQLSDGGWSIADGPGTVFCEPDEHELAGWHLPVRFESGTDATDAIRSGPFEMFDIELESAWAQHARTAGGVACASYAMGGDQSERPEAAGAEPA